MQVTTTGSGRPPRRPLRIGKDFPRIAEIWLDRSPDGRFVLANVQNGDGGGFAQHLRSGRPLDAAHGLADRIVSAVFGADDTLYLLSRAGRRGKVLRLPLGPGRSMDAATTVVPEGEGTIDYLSGETGIVPTKSGCT